MLYFAIAMVFIGVLCFIYVSVSYSGQGGQPIHSPEQKKYPPLRDSLFNARYPDYNKDLYDEKIRREREDFFSKEKVEDEVEKTPDIIESVEVPLTQPQTEVEFVLEGTLFLDKARKIPFADRKFKTKALQDEFSGLMREGDGLMVESNGRFDFKAGNAVYSYIVNELEQIVFFNEGFVFLPFDKSIPAPLFLTEGVSEMKQYLLERKSA